MYSELLPSGQLSWHDKHEKVNKADSLQPSVGTILFIFTFLASCVTLVVNKIRRKKK